MNSKFGGITPKFKKKWQNRGEENTEVGEEGHLRRFTKTHSASLNSAPQPKMTNIGGQREYYKTNMLAETKT